MPTKPELILESAIEGVRTRILELSALEKFGETNAATQLQLECDSDLQDFAALDRIARCQTIAALLPRRKSLRIDALAISQQELLKECHHFISAHLSPRIQKIISRVEAEVREALAPHVQDHELELRVANSKSVCDVAGLSLNTSLANPNLNDVVSYAKRLLAAWNECAEREAKLS